MLGGYGVVGTELGRDIPRVPVVVAGVGAVGVCWRVRRWAVCGAEGGQPALRAVVAVLRRMRGMVAVVAGRWVGGVRRWRGGERIVARVERAAVFGSAVLIQIRMLPCRSTIGSVVEVGYASFGAVMYFPWPGEGKRGLLVRTHSLFVWIKPCDRTGRSKPANQRSRKLR